VSELRRNYIGTSSRSQSEYYVKSRHCSEAALWRSNQPSRPPRVFDRWIQIQRVTGQLEQMAASALNNEAKFQIDLALPFFTSHQEMRHRLTPLPRYQRQSDRNLVGRQPKAFLLFYVTRREGDTSVAMLSIFNNLLRKSLIAANTPQRHHRNPRVKFRKRRLPDNLGKLVQARIQQASNSTPGARAGAI